MSKTEQTQHSSGAAESAVACRHCLHRRAEFGLTMRAPSDDVIEREFFDGVTLLFVVFVPKSQKKYENRVFEKLEFSNNMEIFKALKK